MSIETDILAPLALEKLTPSMKRAQKWIDYSGPVGIVKQRVARVRTNSKNQFNTVDPVYGCVGALSNVDEETGDAYGCPWGCYALFSFKKLKADFATPVPQLCGTNSTPKVFAIAAILFTSVIPPAAQISGCAISTD